MFRSSEKGGALPTPFREVAGLAAALILFATSATAATATTLDTTPPTTPRALTATAGNASVTLSWRGSTDDVGVTAYRIYRQNPDGSWPITATASTAAATRNWTDTGRTAGTTYSYRMTAIDAAGNESPPSATASATPPDTTAPTTPSSFTATPQDTAVKLGWKGSVDDVGVTGYRIYRQDAAGAWPTVPTATTASATRSWTDTGRTNETTYTYRISAVDGAGNESQPSSSVSATPDVPDPQPSFPVRAAFVYAWYPEAWVQGGLNPYTHYHPSLGLYDSGATNVIQNQVQAMQYGRISVGISSWWGQGDTTDSRFATYLSTTAAMKSHFRWSIYYEPEGHGDPSVAELTSDLAYIRDHYGSDRSYYRVGGRFVVFAYSSGADGCGMADRWAQANATINAYIVLKVFPGYRNCLNQPASWHQYAPGGAQSSQAGYSYTISPGFWKASDATPRLPRDLARWTTNVQNMVASRAPFQLITTFNEWGEGTAVESASEWLSDSGYGAYLDVLHSVPPLPPDTTAPTVPPWLTTTGGDGAVTLSWRGATDDVGVVGYRVYRQRSDGTWPSAPTSTAVESVRKWTDTGLSNGTTYTYRVTAVDATGNESVPATAMAIPAPPPCGKAAAAPAIWQHVVWIVMENKAYNQVIGSRSAPYENSLAGQCGLATNYTAITHPSLPNYLAMVSGSTLGVTDDGDPSKHPLDAPTIFSQLGSGRWRALEESMTSNCQLTTSRPYLVKHNPPAYYTNLRSDCGLFDVPLGATPDISAPFTFITPNECNDTHGCPVSTGDNWFKLLIPKLTTSAEYRSGSTAIFITWDEDDFTTVNQIATIVLSPSTIPGTKAATPFTHYSLLRTTEEMLGLPEFLGEAANATSMRTAFHL